MPRGLTKISSLFRSRMLLVYTPDWTICLRNSRALNKRRTIRKINNHMISRSDLLVAWPRFVRSLFKVFRFVWRTHNLFIFSTPVLRAQVRAEKSNGQKLEKGSRNQTQIIVFPCTTKNISTLSCKLKTWSFCCGEQIFRTN